MGDVKALLSSDGAEPHLEKRISDPLVGTTRRESRSFTSNLFMRGNKHSVYGCFQPELGAAGCMRRLGRNQTVVRDICSHVISSKSSAIIDFWFWFLVCISLKNTLCPNERDWLCLARRYFMRFCISDSTEMRFRARHPSLLPQS